MRSAVAIDLPVLCVHDSFISDYGKAKLLKRLMADASNRVLSAVLPIVSDWMGLDEVPEERRTEFTEIRHIEQSIGSIERQGMFEATLEAPPKPDGD